MTEAVIFDMDGVIIDSERDHYVANKRLFAKLGISMDVLEYDRFVGLSSRLMWAEIKDRCNLDQSVEDLIKLGNQAIIDHFSDIELKMMPGFIDLLDYVNERSMLVAIASSSPMELIELVVDKLEIREYFNLLVSGDSVNKGKPYPDIYIRTAALLQVTPANCVVIEDSNNGAQAAKSANMTCIGYQNPSSGNQDLSICDLVVVGFEGDNYEKILDYMW